LEKLKALTDMNKLAEFMDRKVGFTFYDYLFLRRVNAAFTSCGDQGIMQPNHLYCALAITSPRTRQMSPPEEK